jgi:hypothetical protein
MKLNALLQQEKDTSRELAALLQQEKDKSSQLKTAQGM